MGEKKKRRPVDHKHPAVAAAIHVLTEAGGGPLQPRDIFQRAHDAGLLAPTAFNTLRGRLSQHQKVERPVVVKTSAGYMLSPEGIPADTLGPTCAPNRPAALPRVRDARPRSRRRGMTATSGRARPPQVALRARDLIVSEEWLYNQGASRDRIAQVRLALWRWGGKWPTVRQLLMNWLPYGHAGWIIERLPLDPTLQRRLLEARGHAERKAIISSWETRSSSTPSPADQVGEVNHGRAGARA